MACSGLCLPITHVYVVASLYCMFQGITRGRRHRYVVHVSDAECRVE